MSNREMTNESVDAIRDGAVTLLKDNTITAHVFRLVGHIFCHVTNAIDGLQGQVANLRAGVDHCRAMTAKHTNALHKLAVVTKRLDEAVDGLGESVESLHADDSDLARRVRNLGKALDKATARYETHHAEHHGELVRLNRVVDALDKRGRANEGKGDERPAPDKTLVFAPPYGAGKTKALAELLNTPYGSGAVIDETAHVGSIYNKVAKALLERPIYSKRRTAEAAAEALAIVRRELSRAIDKHAPYNSLHEAHSIILEEVEEFFDEVKLQTDKRKSGRTATELAQIATTAVRAMVDLFKAELLGETPWQEPTKTLTGTPNAQNLAGPEPTPAYVNQDGPKTPDIDKLWESLPRLDGFSLSRIDSELWREYECCGHTYRIVDPLALYMRPGGTTHRVVDVHGTSHCVAAPGTNGCVLRWKSKSAGQAVLGIRGDSTGKTGPEAKSTAPNLTHTAPAGGTGPETRPDAQTEAYGAKGCSCYGCMATGQDDLDRAVHGGGRE